MTSGQEFYSDDQIDRLEALQDELATRLQNLVSDPNLTWETDEFEQSESGYTHVALSAALTPNVTLGVNVDEDDSINGTASPGVIWLALDKPKNDGLPGDHIFHYAARVTKRGTIKETGLLTDSDSLFANMNNPGLLGKDDGEMFGAPQTYERMLEILDFVEKDILPKGDDSRLIEWAYNFVPDHHKAVPLGAIDAIFDNAETTSIDEHGELSHIDKLQGFDGPIRLIRYDDEWGAMKRFGMLINPELLAIDGSATDIILPTRVDFIREQDGTTTSDVMLQFTGGSLDPFIEDEDWVGLNSDNFFNTETVTTVDAAISLFMGLASTNDIDAMRAFAGEWSSKYGWAPSSRRVFLSPNQAFDYIKNQVEISGEIEETLLTRQFEGLRQINQYSYQLPRHYGKQVTVESENYYADTISWEDAESGGAVDISIKDANGRQRTVKLIMRGGEVAESDDSPFQIGDTLRDALEAILDQDDAYPALGQEIRQHLASIDNDLFSKLATATFTPEHAAKSIAAIRYYIGRSGVQPERTRVRYVPLF
jgi:hypothetical protein